MAGRRPATAPGTRDGDGCIADLLAQRGSEPVRLNARQKMRLDAMNLATADRARRKEVHRRNMKMELPNCFNEAHPKWFCTFGEPHPMPWLKKVQKKAPKRRRRFTRAVHPPTPPPQRPRTPPEPEFFLGHRVLRHATPVRKRRDADWLGRSDDPTTYVTVAAASYLRQPAGGRPANLRPPAEKPSGSMADVMKPVEEAAEPAAKPVSFLPRRPTPAEESEAGQQKLAPQPPPRRPPACPKPADLPPPESEVGCDQQQQQQQPRDGRWASPRAPPERPPSSRRSEPVSSTATTAENKAAADRFPVGCVVRVKGSCDGYGGQLGMVVGHARGRVGLRLAGGGATVGLMPTDLIPVARGKLPATGSGSSDPAGGQSPKRGAPAMHMRKIAGRK